MVLPRLLSVFRDFSLVHIVFIYSISLASIQYIRSSISQDPTRKQMAWPNAVI